MYEVRLSSRAEKSFLALAERDARRVAAALRLLGIEPMQPGTIKLSGALKARYRHRVGDLRILFDVDHDGKVVQVYDIRRRGERTQSKATTKPAGSLAPTPGPGTRRDPAGFTLASV